MAHGSYFALPEPQYIGLPFYEVEWLRKDVTQGQNTVVSPSVRIIVSGLISNLVYYSALTMPLQGDFETNVIKERK